MNRASRRENKTERKEPVYTLKKSDLDKMLRESFDEGKKARKQEFDDGIRKSVDDAFILMICISIKVMHDRYGWRVQKRLTEFSNAVIDEYQKFLDGETTIEQYQQYVYECCGLKFEADE